MSRANATTAHRRSPDLERLETKQLLASFQGLGFLPSSNPDSHVGGISADGSTVVGWSAQDSVPGNINQSQAFAWRTSTGMVGLGDVSGGADRSAALGVSADGSLIVGQGTGDAMELYDPRFYTVPPTSRPQAVAWRSGALEELFTPPARSNVQWGVSAAAVSNDGSIIVGIYGGQPATVLQGPNGRQPLPIPAGAYGAYVNALSGNGAIIVGSSTYERNGLPLDMPHVWSVNASIDLPLFNGYRGGVATAVSADGGSIVGWNHRTDTATGLVLKQAFLWRAGSGTVALGDLNGGIVWSEARDVSGNGSVIVGAFRPRNGDADAFIWDAVHGMRSLSSVLTTEQHVNLQGWILREATAVSDDGRTIAGTGMDPQGRIQAWVARLDPTDTTGPTVVSIQRRGVHWAPTQLVVTFSEGVDPATALRPEAYRLVCPGRDGKFGTRDDVRIPISSVIHQPGSNLVVLTPAKRLPLALRLQITISGNGVNAVTDAAGNRVDGDANGVPGGDHVRIFQGFHFWRPAATTVASRSTTRTIRR